MSAPARCRCLLIAALVVPPAGLVQQPWFAQQDVRERLLAREIVVRATPEADAARGYVSAAVLIAASPEVIWDVMTDCARASTFVPGLRRCRVLDSSPDGSGEVIEHEVKYSWLLPAVHYVFRANYSKPSRIQFHRVSGDLREQHGEWRLEAVAGATATIVEYEIYLDPGFLIPAVVVRHALRKDVPALLAALRARVEQPSRYGAR